MYVLSTVSDTYYFLSKNEILFLTPFFLRTEKIFFLCLNRKEKISPAPGPPEIFRRCFNLEKAAGKI